LPFPSTLVQGFRPRSGLVTRQALPRPATGAPHRPKRPKAKHARFAQAFFHTAKQTRMPFLDASALRPWPIHTCRAGLAFSFGAPPPRYASPPFFTKCQVTEHMQGCAGACFCMFPWHPSELSRAVLLFLSVNTFCRSARDLHDRQRG
jgi:hypothetical protein